MGIRGCVEDGVVSLSRNSKGAYCLQGVVCPSRGLLLLGVRREACGSCRTAKRRVAATMERASLWN